MKKRDFLKQLGISAAELAAASTVLTAPGSDSDKPQIAVDINSISNFTVGGKRITSSEIMDIYRKERVLFYNSTKGYAPTTSTTVMTVIGDILVVLLQEAINFSLKDYAKRHHGGYIGGELK